MIFSGIQQMGIGVPDEKAGFDWYRTHFGMDIRMFQEAAEAPLMTPYTGDKVQSRSATLAINMKGGGGFEIWQYTSRKTVEPFNDLQLGDYGIYICKMHCASVNEGYRRHKEAGLQIIGEIQVDPAGVPYYFLRDLFGNLFQVVETGFEFSRTNSPFGGVYGAVIGVSDIHKAQKLYTDILGFDQVLYDSNQSEDLERLPGGDGSFRRLCLTRSEPSKGPFSPLLGPACIELIEKKDTQKGRAPQKIFENRFWGDAGFIHLCFDVRKMNRLKRICETGGFPFTVDSSDTFDMGEAAGRFSYVEDPDGTLIEFVEVHKIPILKKFGIFLNLKNRPPSKALPRFMLKAMGFNRVK